MTSGQRFQDQWIKCKFNNFGNCRSFSCVFEIVVFYYLLFSEVLYEDETFRSRAFAALVASKVFYHLGAFEESLNYALGAGELFNVTDESEYVETIIGE